MWHYSVALLAAFLAVAVIVGLSLYAHNDSSARIYSALVTLIHPEGVDALDISTGTTGAAAWAAAQDAAREGARWAHDLHCEATIWAIVILVLTVLALGVKFFFPRF